MNTRKTQLVMLASVLAVAGLAACSPRDQPVVPAPSATVTPADNSARATADQAAMAARDAANTTGAAAKNAATTVGDKVSDSMITASVKTELAKDASLSALAINVDTSNGSVTMNGTAPTDAARSQATMLAKAVKGVVAVDNKLIVAAKK